MLKNQKIQLYNRKEQNEYNVLHRYAYAKRM